MAKARTFAGLGVQAMADELGLTRSTIRDYEHDVRPPKRALILAYAMRCNVDQQWIEDGEPGVVDRRSYKASDMRRSKRACIGGQAGVSEWPVRHETGIVLPFRRIPVAA